MSFLHVMFPRSKKQKKLNEISFHQCTYCFATTAILFVQRISLCNFQSNQILCQVNSRINFTNIMCAALVSSIKYTNSVNHDQRTYVNIIFSQVSLSLFSDLHAKCCRTMKASDSVSIYCTSPVSQTQSIRVGINTCKAAITLRVSFQGF